MSVFRKDTNSTTRSRERRTPHDGMAQLLRRPAVQVCLLVTAIVQVVAVSQTAEANREITRVAVLAPVMVQPGAESVTSLWARHAAEREASKLAQKYRLEGYSVSAQLAESIAEAAVENGIDLIAMTTRTRGGLERWLLGSVADKVIRGTYRPVLVHRGMPAHEQVDVAGARAPQVAEQIEDHAIH